MEIRDLSRSLFFAIFSLVCASLSAQWHPDEVEGISPDNPGSRVLRAWELLGLPIEESSVFAGEWDWGSVSRENSGSRVIRAWEFSGELSGKVTGAPLVLASSEYLCASKFVSLNKKKQISNVVMQ